MGKTDLVFSNQNHGTKILSFAKQFNREPSGGLKVSPSGKDRNPGEELDSRQELTGDALITDIREKGIVIQTADCQPVLIFDPVRKVVANVHSGWRGSIKNIIGLTLEEMKINFGCNAGNMTAGVGPSLGPCCCEFVNYRREFPEALWRYREGNHFDLWELSRDQLLNGGVTREKIFLSKICTKCSTDLFFSYRAEKTTGRFASFIGLR